MKKSYVCLYKAGMRVQKIGFLFTSLDKIIMTIAQITLFFLGGIRVMEGILTIGEFTIISTYFSMILGAIRYFFGFREIYTRNASFVGTAYQCNEH